MIDIRTGKDLKEYPVLQEPELRIYVMLNSVGKVKIGKTKDIYKRYKSLCGSNGQGNEIVSVLVSPPTYLYTIETIMHNKFDRYRIPNTEWFYDKANPSGEKLFSNAVEELKLLFSSACYKTSNDLRKQIYELNKEKKDKNEKQ